MKLKQEDLVEKIRKCDNDDELEKLFEDYIKGENLKN